RHRRLFLGALLVFFALYVSAPGGVAGWSAGCCQSLTQRLADDSGPSLSPSYRARTALRSCSRSTVSPVFSDRAQPTASFFVMSSTKPGGKSGPNGERGCPTLESVAGRVKSKRSPKIFRPCCCAGGWLRYGLAGGTLAAGSYRQDSAWPQGGVPLPSFPFS